MALKIRIKDRPCCGWSPSPSNCNPADAAQRYDEWRLIASSIAVSEFPSEFGAAGGVTVEQASMRRIATQISAHALQMVTLSGPGISFRNSCWLFLQNEQ
jgi:hypothetical protein